ncbi:MAG: hypothetical protein LBT02_00735 [Rickettsiales bacterium]|jgi:hypothetical protein|nr:hypothetical protein [Rickettsiales bacterium]
MKKYEEIKPIYDAIFKGLNGYVISLLEKEQRQDKESIFKDILYGEVSLELLYALFVLPPINKYIEKAKIFYDLGSGIGNAVISAYLTGAFEKCVGVELMDSLYKTSMEAKSRMQENSNIIFINDNILNINVVDADIVLFCCPTKDEKLRYEMEKKFITLKSGSVILSLIHKFKNEKDFELIDAKLVKVAWGETPLFIYEKI